MMHIIFLIFLSSQLATSIPSETCYANITNPYQMFSTYTPYEYVREQSSDPVVIPQCEPVHFWIFSRHGTRYTDNSGIRNIWNLTNVRDQVISNHEANRGSLCSEDLENLQKWTPQAVTTVSMNLSPQGYKDLHNMAVRFKSRFPELLNNTYSPDLYEVRFTDTQRTTASAVAFLEGMFGSTHFVKMPQPIDDEVLVPEDCQNWRKKVGNDKDVIGEWVAFNEGPEIATVLKDVSSRLGFDTELTLDDVDDIYTACRFEKAWNIDQISPWCAAFTDDELEVLLYREDIWYYYEHGYGSAMNIDVGCPPAKDFLDRLSDIENGGKQPLGVFYFSHDTDLQLFLTSLGVVKDDEKLTHSNYQEMKDRKWQTSILTPFAGNFAVVFFKCDAGEQYRVQFYLREKLLELDGCSDGLCDWSYIKQNYGPIASNCDRSICGN